MMAESLDRKNCTEKVIAQSSEPARPQDGKDGQSVEAGSDSGSVLAWVRVVERGELSPHDVAQRLDQGQGDDVHLKPYLDSILALPTFLLDRLQLLAPPRSSAPSSPVRAGSRTTARTASLPRHGVATQCKPLQTSNSEAGIAPDPISGPRRRVPTKRLVPQPLVGPERDVTSTPVTKKDARIAPIPAESDFPSLQSTTSQRSGRQTSSRSKPHASGNLSGSGATADRLPAAPPAASPWSRTKSAGTTSHTFDVATARPGATRTVSVKTRSSMSNSRQGCDSGGTTVTSPARVTNADAARSYSGGSLPAMAETTQEIGLSEADFRLAVLLGEIGALVLAKYRPQLHPGIGREMQVLSQVARACLEALRLAPALDAAESNSAIVASATQSGITPDEAQRWVPAFMVTCTVALLARFPRLLHALGVGFWPAVEAQLICFTPRLQQRLRALWPIASERSSSDEGLATQLTSAFTTVDPLAQLLLHESQQEVDKWLPVLQSLYEGYCLATADQHRGHQSDLRSWRLRAEQGKAQGKLDSWAQECWQQLRDCKLAWMSAVARGLLLMMQDSSLLLPTEMRHRAIERQRIRFESARFHIVFSFVPDLVDVLGSLELRDFLSRELMVALEEAARRTARDRDLVTGFNFLFFGGRVLAQLVYRTLARPLHPTAQERVGMELRDPLSLCVRLERAHQERCLVACLCWTVSCVQYLAGPGTALWHGCPEVLQAIGLLVRLERATSRFAEPMPHGSLPMLFAHMLLGETLSHPRLERLVTQARTSVCEAPPLLVQLEHYHFVDARLPGQWRSDGELSAALRSITQPIQGPSNEKVINPERVTDRDKAAGSKPPLLQRKLGQVVTVPSIEGQMTTLIQTITYGVVQKVQLWLQSSCPSIREGQYLLSSPEDVWAESRVQLEAELQRGCEAVHQHLALLLQLRGGDMAEEAVATMASFYVEKLGNEVRALAKDHLGSILKAMPIQRVDEEANPDTMAGSDTSVFRSLTNEINVAGVLRWTWRMVDRQPTLVAATAMGAFGVLLVAATSSENGFTQKDDQGRYGSLIQRRVPTPKEA